MLHYLLLMKFLYSLVLVDRLLVKLLAELGLALTADLDTDGTLAANSDTKYPSQKAVKTYADTKSKQQMQL